MLTQTRLKEVLNYDPLTGLFSNKAYRHGCSWANVGSETATGYLEIRIDYKSYKSHRLAFLYMTGEIPEIVDHIDGNRKNNRWSNLRACTKSQNQMNAKLYKSNKSGVKGVYWNKATKSWRARIRVNGKVHQIGMFNSIEAAKTAITAARLKYHKEFARSA